MADELGAPTVLVNNAGLLRDNLLFKMSDDDWDTVIDVHLRGSFLMTRATQKHMVAAKYGRIVNTSSSSALGNRGQVNYSAAKAGLQGFTKTLAMELGQFGITANAVAPGFIATDMTAATAGPGRHGLRGLQERGRGQHPGAPRRRARGRRAHRFVPGQRGCRLRVRPGHLRGGRSVVLNNPALGNTALSPDDIRAKVKEFLATHDPIDHAPARLPAGSLRRRAGLGALPGRAAAAWARRGPCRP